MESYNVHNSRMSSTHMNARFSMVDSNVKPDVVISQCVQKLKGTTNQLKAILEKLDKGAQEFQRLKTVLKCERTYELVSEKEVNEQMSKMVKCIEPQVDDMLDKAEEMLQNLKDKEAELQKEYDENEADYSFVQKQKSTVNQKRIRILKAKKNRLMENIKNLDPIIQDTIERIEELKAKKQEISKRINTPSTPRAPKQKKKDIARNVIEDLKRQLAEVKQRNQTQEINLAMKQKDLELKKQKLKSPTDISEVSESFDAMEIDVSTDNTDLKNAKLREQIEFFNQVKKFSMSLDCDNKALYNIIDLEQKCREYVMKLRKEKAGALIIIEQLKQNRNKRLKNTQSITSILYPIGNLGDFTLPRIIEMLLQSKNKEILVKDLEREFPVSDVRKNQLNTALRILDDIGAAQTVLEYETSFSNIDIQDIRECSLEGQLWLRIKPEE